MTRLETLRKAKEFLSDKDNWTKDTFARDKYGRPCMPEDFGAEKFCFLGAMSKVRGGSLYPDFRLAEQDTIRYVNDSLGYDDVMKLADRLIAAELAKNGESPTTSESNQ